MAQGASGATTQASRADRLRRGRASMPPLRTESYYPPPWPLPYAQGSFGCVAGGRKGRYCAVDARPTDGGVCRMERSADGAATGTAGADGAARDYVLFRTATAGSVGSSNARATTTNATFANAATASSL